MNYPNHNQQPRRSNHRQNHRNNRGGNREGNRNLISLDYEKIKSDQQFIEHAKEIAENLEYRGKNQIRKFYDEFNMASDSQNIFKLRMLLPKIHYQKSRKVLKDNMAEFLKKLIEWAIKDQDLERAKLFFEAVYGFYGEGK